jgi:hypothetical protein
MDIKDRKTGWKFPRIMFHTTWANFMLIIVLAFLFINSMLYFVHYSSFSLISSGFIVFGMISIFLLLASVNESFTRNSPEVHFSDLKRTAIYMFITFFIFAYIHYYNEHHKVVAPPPPLVKEKTIKIVELSIFDVQIKKIKYMIGYKDNNGTTCYKSTFDTLDDRNDYLDTLVGKDNKFKVEINFKIDKHNNGSLEIIKQTIKGL